MMLFLTLFYEFFKVGLFSVGGGLATIPFLNEIAEKYPWFDSSELSDMIAVSESTPGPIGVNMATYAGYNAGFSDYGIPGGILGGIIATAGIIVPAIIVICIVSKFMEKFKTNKFVNYAFYGIRPAVAGLITGAMASVFIAAIFILKDEVISGINVPAAIIFAVMTALCAKFKKLHPIIFIAAGALTGIIFSL